MAGVLAVDPGRGKCGVAVVDRSRGVLFQGVVEAQRLTDLVRELLRVHCVTAVVVGDRTGSRPVVRELRGLAEVQALGGLHLVDEAGTSLEARRRYLRAHPPRGIWKIIPEGLRSPPGPVDDWAAVVLAERYLRRIRVAGPLEGLGRGSGECSPGG